MQSLAWWPLLLQLKHMTLLVSHFFLESFLETLMALLPMAEVFFSSLFSRNLRFLSFLSFLPYSEDSAALIRGRVEAFSLAGFALLSLDSLGRGFFAVVSWVCTFKAILLEGR